VVWPDAASFIDRPRDLAARCKKIMRSSDPITLLHVMRDYAPKKWAEIENLCKYFLKYSFKVNFFTKIVFFYSNYKNILPFTRKRNQKP